MDTTYRALPDTIGHLLTITDREALLARMQAIDLNGAYTDAMSAAEGMDPLQLEEARAIVRGWEADCT